MSTRTYPTEFTCCYQLSYNSAFLFGFGVSVGPLLSAMEVPRSNLRYRKRMARINPISNGRVLVFKPIVDCSSMSHLCLFPQGRSCGGMFLFAVSLQKPRLRLNTGHTHTHDDDIGNRLEFMVTRAHCKLCTIL